jgi:hypothetical protein
VRSGNLPTRAGGAYLCADDGGDRATEASADQAGSRPLRHTELFTGRPSREEKQPPRDDQREQALDPSVAAAALRATDRAAMPAATATTGSMSVQPVKRTWAARAFSGRYCPSSEDAIC